MSGAEVFAMEPDRVHSAVEDLFDIEAEVDSASSAIKDETETVGSGLAGGNFAVGAALTSAGGWWHGLRAGGFGRRLGNMGEYLATCAEEAVEIDEYNADAFREYADLDRYADRPNAQVADYPARPNGGL
ncbi:hypothetical protein [Glycomyces tarimensis]